MEGRKISLLICVLCVFCGWFSFLCPRSSALSKWLGTNSRRAVPPDGISACWRRKDLGGLRAQTRSVFEWNSKAPRGKCGPLPPKQKVGDADPNAEATDVSWRKLREGAFVVCAVIFHEASVSLGCNVLPASPCQLKKCSASTKRITLPSGCFENGR